MAGSQSSEAKGTVRCHLCQSGPLEKIQYVGHVVGKRHQKNLKNRSKGVRKDEMKRTLHVTGYQQATPVEALIGAFWRYEVLNVTTHTGYSFVELKNRQIVKDVLSNVHHIGTQKLKVSLRRQTQHSDIPPIKLSWRVKTALNKPFISPQNQWNTIIMLVNEIELKPGDYEKRDYLRREIEQFLSPHFPVVTAHVFGSSANNLGFEGCDVDLYVSLGIDPWAQGGKAEKESKARDVTWYIARKIMSAKRGIKVQAIARARVPIVKFEDPVTRLQVDLSFRHGMPVYNTRLICQYTRTHLLVRPYLMVIRFWAKVQDVAGGGQPTYLITNYGLTMLMLFYLMARAQPMIPSVAELKSQCPIDYRGEHTIGGWDCSFGSEINEWSRKRHSVSVMELVSEFFSYFGNFDPNKWVVSPLAGQLLDKNAVKHRNLQKLPPCMRIYCAQETDIQTDTALCLQDPFEHSYNITRGLKEGPFTEFQYKCRRAAEISQDIIKGEKPLADLFEEVDMDEEVLKDIRECDSPNSKEVDISQEEVITLDDSDDTSQDEIEVLNVSSSKMEDSGATSSTSQASVSKTNGESNDDSDFLVIDKVEDEIEISEINHDSCEVVPNNDSGLEIITENGVSDIQDDSDFPINISETLPENKLFKFPLDFSTTREFTITFDGSISGGKEIMTSEDDIKQAACSLIHFILQQCLKIEVSPVESSSEGGKRKSESPPKDGEPGKRIKNADGDSVCVIMKHRRVAQYRCTAETQLWIGRRKVAKSIPSSVNHNPLQYEMSVTEAQISLGLNNEINVDIGKLEFTISVWQNVDNPANILVTGDSISNERVTKGMMMPLFLYLSSLTPNLLKKVVLYIVKTSSKR